MDKKTKQKETFALSPVPAGQRKSWGAMVMVQAGMVICVPAFMLGSLLAQGMSTINAIVAGSIGYLMVLLITFILGMQGADLGIPTCAVSQSTFGKNGTRLLVSSLLAISLVGFFGIQCSVCGEAFVSLMQEGFGIAIPSWVSTLIWGLIMVFVAVVGMEGLKNVDTISVPLLLIIMAVGLIMAFRMYGTGGITENEVIKPTMSMASGIGLSFSFFSASAFSAADLTRFQRDRKDTVKSSVWGLIPAGIITCVIGVLLTRVANVYDITIVLAAVGLPLLGAVVLILASVTTNSINAYCGGLNTIMTFNLPDNRRREATAAIGILGVVLALFGILDFMEGFLNYISFLGAPIAGVMIADYWVCGKGRKESWHALPGWNWTGIGSALISLVIAWFIPIGIFNFNGLVVGFIVYLIIEHFVPSRSRQLDGDFAVKGDQKLAKDEGGQG